MDSLKQVPLPHIVTSAPRLDADQFRDGAQSFISRHIGKFLVTLATIIIAVLSFVIVRSFSLGTEYSIFKYDLALIKTVQEENKKKFDDNEKEHVILRKALEDVASSNKVVEERTANIKEQLRFVVETLNRLDAKIDRR